MDVLAFPPSIALRTTVNLDPELTRRLLRYGYERCKGLLAIDTKNYGTKGIKGNWTEMEWTGNLEAGKPLSPPPFRWVYRFDKSVFLTNLVQKHDLMTSMEWHEVAKKIRGEMEAHVPLPD